VAASRSVELQRERRKPRMKSRSATEPSQDKQHMRARQKTSAETQAKSMDFEYL
jgi:hypothetical protein